MGYPVRLPFLLFLMSVLAAGAGLQAQTGVPTHEAGLQLELESPQWPEIQRHLPDPATASPDRLELAADVLRVRRFPENAVDYYLYALKRGAEESKVLNKIGVTELELGNRRLAREYFQRIVHLKKKDADAWNNLAAVEYLDGLNGSAISDYKRAIKLNKKSAIFHSNLGTAYFQAKDFERSRKEFDVALKIDPDLMAHRAGVGGVTMRMLSPEDHARFNYELARLYAQHGDEAKTLHYLTAACEGGFDVIEAMKHDEVLGPYRKDPRVILLVHNAQALRSNHLSLTASASTLPPLPAGQN
jgi:tetratricopeptide (TPR) repeat protein